MILKRLLTLTIMLTGLQVSCAYADTPPASGCPSQLKFVATSSYDDDPWTTIAELGLEDKDGNRLDKSQWSLAYVDTEELAGEYAPATQAFDNDPNTFWHTEWLNDGIPHPHEIVINLNGQHDLKTLHYLPRQDNDDNGRVRGYKVYVKTNQSPWTLAADDELADTANEQAIQLQSQCQPPPQTATCPSYIKLTTSQSYDRDPWAVIAELGLEGREGNMLDKSQWSLVSVDSEELIGEYAPATQAFDGDPNTFWHSEWLSNNTIQPHEIVINLNGSYDLKALHYLARQDDDDNGHIRKFKVFVSTDGISWAHPVASGEFADSKRQQITQLTNSCTQPTITQPIAGSTLSGSSMAVRWTNNGRQVERWRIQAGDKKGKNNYYDSKNTLGASIRQYVTGLPIDGSIIYVTLSYRINGAWASVYSQYVAKPSNPNECYPNAHPDYSCIKITSPKNLSSLPDDSLVTITWKPINNPMPLDIGISAFGNFISLPPHIKSVTLPVTDAKGIHRIQVKYHTQEGRPYIEQGSGTAVYHVK